MKQIIGVIFLVFVILVGMIIIESNDPNKLIESISSDSSINNDENEEVVEEVIIRITGQVVKPGEYKTNSSNFLQDIINQAGGITSLADEACFDYFLVLTYDMDIYIPKATDEIKISLNDATIEELTELNGIGNTLANRIIDYRQTIGKFNYLEQIMEVDGIGKSIFHKIKDQICL